MKRWFQKKRWLQILLICLLIAVAVPWIPADLFRSRIQKALEQSLGRKVEIAGAHFTVFPSMYPGPGLVLDQVLIHEDPRAGIEPFAYIETLGATVRLTSLLSGRLEFSNLDLGDATVNIVKPATGPWNYQLLLNQAASSSRAFPAVRMRGGRVNFKFADTKSLFYFNEADLDVSASPDGSLDLRFGGVPSRTNRAVQDFGRLFVNGRATPGNESLSLRVELEPSSLEESLRWFVPGAFGVHGTVSLTAQLTGPPSNLNVKGNLQIGDFHRWDLLPTQGGNWQLDYQGHLDLGAQRLELTSTPAATGQPVAAHLYVSHWMTLPEWSAGVDLHELSVDTILKIAKHMGAAFPDALAVDGKLSGSLTYAQPDGLTGTLDLSDTVLTLPGAEPVTAAAAPVTIRGGFARIGRALVKAPGNQTAEIEASYALDGWQDSDSTPDLDLTVVTRGMDIAVMRTFAKAGIPVIQDAAGGTWRGTLRYREGVWFGDFELRKATLSVPGLSEPVNIDTATVNLNAAKVRVSKLHGKAGPIEFAGEYRWEPSAARPNRFTLAMGEVDGSQLRALFSPVLNRDSGFIARTLRLGAPELPEWLKDRHAEGSLAIDTLNLGDYHFTGVSSRMQWDGADVRFPGLRATLEGTRAEGDLRADFSPRIPRVRFEGRIADVPWKGGMIDFDTRIDAGGSSAFFSSLHAQGRFTARRFELTPDVEFRLASGDFEVQGFGPQAKWKLANVEASQGGEQLTGSGASQPDGRLVVDLAGKGKPVRYTANLQPPPAQ